MMQTLDQKRASHAWDVVQRVKSLPSNDKDREQFGVQVKKLPTRIMASGLGQALAFLAAKKYAPSLQAALREWMAQRRPVPNGDDGRLVVRVIHGDAEFLRYATAECLAYLQWLVKFADAEGITKDEVDTPQEQSE